MPAKRKAALKDFSSTVANGGVFGIFLANGPAVAGNSHQSSDYPARSAIKTLKAKPHSLPRQRNIRRALIEAYLVDTALRDSAFPQCKAAPQVLSAAKNIMVALLGQLFYSTQIPVCLWFLAKIKKRRRHTRLERPTWMGKSIGVRSMNHSSSQIL
jgi:hypothetical protein